jgi:hypothetical protein
LAGFGVGGVAPGVLAGFEDEGVEPGAPRLRLEADAGGAEMPLRDGITAGRAGSVEENKGGAEASVVVWVGSTPGITAGSAAIGGRDDGVEDAGAEAASSLDADSPSD